MAEQRLLSHQLTGEPALPQRLAKSGVRFDRSGENVAFDRNAESAHEGLMNSPPHRANILNPEFTAAGMGAVYSNGQLWVTQNFVRQLEFHTVNQAENMVARKFDELRRTSGEKPLQRSALQALRPLACRMATEGKLDTRSALGLVGSGSAVAFTSSDLAELPSNVREMARRPGFSKYAVGGCFQESDAYPSGAYWMVIVLQ
jgi:hypothetical protein